MRSAITLFAVAGMTMAKNTHQGEDVPVVKGPTPVDKPYVHWGDKSYADAVKKGANLSLFKLPTFGGEDSRLSGLRDRLSQRIAGLKKRLHTLGEEGVVRGRRLGNKAKAGLKRLHKHHNDKHHGGEEGHAKLHALATKLTSKLGLFKLPTFGGEDSRLTGLRARLNQRLASLKQRLHRFGEDAAVKGRRFAKRAAAGIRRLHNHGEQSHVKKTANLALFKKISFGEDSIIAKAHALLHPRAQALKTELIHAGEEAVRKTRVLGTRIAGAIKNLTGEDSIIRKTIVNRGAWAFLKKKSTRNGEDSIKRKHKKNQKKDRKNKRKTHRGESTHKKSRNPLSRRSKRHARKHSGEESVRKSKKPAALGLYQLSSLLNLNDA